jgi:hypothetical protein
VWWEAKLTPRVRTEWGYMSKAMTDSGENDCNHKVGRLLQGKKKEGSRSGLESFRLRGMGFVLVARSAMGILILYSELSD